MIINATKIIKYRIFAFFSIIGEIDKSEAISTIKNGEKLFLIMEIDFMI